MIFHIKIKFILKEKYKLKKLIFLKINQYLILILKIYQKL